MKAGLYYGVVRAYLKKNSYHLLLYLRKQYVVARVIHLYTQWI